MQIRSGADLRGRGGGWGPAPLTPHFEAQIFATAATPLRNVGKISAAPPYTNPGSPPADPDLMESTALTRKKT